MGAVPVTTFAEDTRRIAGAESHFISNDNYVYSSSDGEAFSLGNDETAIYLSGSPNDWKGAKVPATVNGKKVAVLGTSQVNFNRPPYNPLFRGFYRDIISLRVRIDSESTNKEYRNYALNDRFTEKNTHYGIYGIRNISVLNSLDFSKAKNLKLIAPQAFMSSVRLDKLEIKNLPELIRIGNYAFANIKYFFTSPQDENEKQLNIEDFSIGDIVLENLPKLKTIEDGTFYKTNAKSITIKNLPELTNIGENVFYQNKATSVILNDLPKLTKIGKGAFNGCSIENLDLSGTNIKALEAEVFEGNYADKIKIILPKLESIGVRAFSSNTFNEINLDEVPNLKEICAFGFGYSKNLAGTLDFRKFAELKLHPLAFRNSPKISCVLVADPGEDVVSKSFSSAVSDDLKYEKIDGLQISPPKQYYVEKPDMIDLPLHRTNFEFYTLENDGLPEELKALQPKNFGVYLKDLKDFDTAKYTGFEKGKKWIDTNTGNVWKFEGWETNSQPKYLGSGRNSGKYPMLNYTGEWQIECNKKALKEALDAANAKRQDVVTSANGEDQPFTKKWVTEADKNTFDQAITAAQGVFDNKNIQGNTLEARQKVIDNATEALKQATAAYNPQEGKLTFEKNPTYAQPQGAHKVTFVKGEGIESLTDENTFFFVQNGTKLPAEQFPQAKVKNGFGTKIFWDPAQDTPITADKAFTASAKEVDKAALQEKIKEAEGLLAKDSTSDPAVALKTVVDEAKTLITAIDNGSERNQDKVDKKVTELESAIQALKDLNTKKEEAKTALDNLTGDNITDENINKAQEKIDKVTDEAEKQKLQEKLDKIKETKAEKEAEDAVKALEEKNGAVTEEEINAAKDKIAKVNDQDKKNDLNKRIGKVEEAKQAHDADVAAQKKAKEEATEAVGELEKPNANVTDDAIKEAQKKIDKVTDEAEKQKLQEKLDKIKEAKAEKEAEDAVKALEEKNGAVTEEEINAAKEKIAKVNDEQKKNDLNKRIGKVEEAKQAHDADVAAQKKAKEEATEAVGELEKPNANVTDDAIKEAQKKIDKVTDEAEKQKLQEKLDKIKETKAEKEAEDAVKALEEKNGAVTEEEINAAKEKIAKVNDEQKKNDLNKRIGKVEEAKQAHDADEKAIEDADKALNELLKPNANVTDDAIKEAQKKIDKVKDPEEKKKLQKGLDDIIEAKAQLDAENALKELEKPGANITQALIEDAQKKIDKIKTVDKKNGYQGRLDKIKADLANTTQEKEKLAKELEEAKKAAEKAQQEAAEAKAKAEEARQAAERAKQEAEEKAKAAEEARRAAEAEQDAARKAELERIAEQKKQEAEEAAKKAAEEARRKEEAAKEAQRQAEAAQREAEQKAKEAAAAEKEKLAKELEEAKKAAEKAQQEAAEAKAAAERAKAEAEEKARQAEEARRAAEAEQDAARKAELERIAEQKKQEAEEAAKKAAEEAKKAAEAAKEAAEKAKAEAEAREKEAAAAAAAAQAAEVQEKARLEAEAEAARRAAEEARRKEEAAKEAQRQAEEAQREAEQKVPATEEDKNNAKTIIENLPNLSPETKEEAKKAAEAAKEAAEKAKAEAEAREKEAAAAAAAAQAAEVQEKARLEAEAEAARRAAEEARRKEEAAKEAQRQAEEAQREAEQKVPATEEDKNNAKTIIENLPNLSPEAKEEAKKEIDKARTKGDIERIVEEAKNSAGVPSPTPTPTPEPTPSYPRYDYNPFWNIYFGSSVTNKTTTTPQPQKKIVIKLQTKLVIGSKEMIKAVDGVEQKVMMDIAPFIDSNRTMLPIRFVAEALGFKVEWDDPSRTVILTDKDNVVRIPVDTNKIIVNGNEYESDVKPVLRNNRTMLPIGNIARALGLKDGTDIIWDAATRTVVIKREIEK